MSYTITHANGSNPIVISDGTVDTSTSISLVGRNTANYGQFINQNFLNMLENFANSSQPANPITGQLWYNTSKGIMQVFNGTYFKNVSSATVSTSAPVQSPVAGDFWFDSVNLQLKVYTGSTWQVIGPVSGTGQVVSKTLYDQSNNPHSVISMQLSGVDYAILSNSAAFTPSPPISQFGTIYPGFNLASTGFVPNNRFVGIATSADAVNTISGPITGDNFMRKDINTTTVGTVSVLNNNGLFVGTGSIGAMQVSGNELQINHQSNNGIIRLQTKTSLGGTADALDILGNADVNINANLIVQGNINLASTAQYLNVNGTAQSYNVNSGAVVVGGGLGVSGNLTVGGRNNTFIGNIFVGNIIANGNGNTGTLLSSNVYAANIGNVGTTFTGTTALLSTISAGTIGNTGAILNGTLSAAIQPNVTSLGTLTSLAVSGSITPTSNNSITLGNTTSYWSYTYSNVFIGTRTSAVYGDLAEVYELDYTPEVGDIIVIGGDCEATNSKISHDPRVLGVVSDKPAYLMNKDANGTAIALTGRVPVKVKGPISRGDCVVTSDIPSVGQKLDNLMFNYGCVVGKSLVDILDDSTKLIEVVVGVK